MAKDGVIYGKEVIPDLYGELKKADNVLVEMIKNIEAFKKSASSIVVPSQANGISKNGSENYKKGNDEIKKRNKLLKDLADIEKKNYDAIKAGVNAEIAKINLQKKSVGVTRTNLTEYKSLNNAYQQQSRLLNDLRNKYKALGIQQLQGNSLTKEQVREYNSLGVQIKKLDSQLKRVDATAGQFQRNVGNYPAALKGATRSLRAFVGAFGFTGGIFLFAKTLKDTVGIFKEFDQGQANLAAILGKNKKDIKALTKQAKDLGATTAFTANQVSELQLELSKLGFNEGQILSAAEGVENLAIATGVDAARGAKLAGSALRGFNLAAEESNRVASVLAVSTTKSASSFETLEIALPKVSAIAKSFGFTIEDTTALLGGLQNAGFEASIAGTSLRQIFLQLADSNGKLAKRLGGGAKNFDQLIEQFKKVEKEGISLGEAFNLTNARSVAAFKVFLQGADDLKVLRDSITDVEDELSQLADTKLDSLTGDVVLLNSAWEGFVLSIEDGRGSIGSFFREAIQGVTNFLVGLRSAGVTGANLGVDAARNIVDDFKNGTENTTGEVKNFILKTIQESEKNIDSLRAKVNELKDSVLVSEDDEGNLSYYGIGASPLGEIRQLQKDLEKEISTRNELTEILKEEGRIKEDLVKRTAQLAVLVNAEKGNEVDLQKQIQYFTSLTTNNLEKLNKEYSDFLKNLDKGGSSGSKGRKIDFTPRIKKLDIDTEGLASDFDEQIKILAKALKLEGFEFDFEFGADGLDALGADELTDKLKEIVKGYEDVAVAAGLSAEQQSKIFGQLNGVFAEYYNLDFSAFEGLLAGKEQLLTDYTSFANSIVGAHYDSKQINYENDLENHRKLLDSVLSDNTKSDKQKEIAQTKFDKKEAAIKNKQAKANRDAILAQIAVETSLGIISALAQTPKFDYGISAGVLAAFIGTVGAAQAAIVASTKLPQFFRGKDEHNKFEGLATWGEKRPEVRVDKHGNVELSPNKTTPTFIKRDDIIVPSLPQFMSTAQNPNSEIAKRLSNKLERDNSERIKVINTSASTDTRRLEEKLDKLIMATYGLGKRPIKVTVEEPYTKY